MLKSRDEVLEALRAFFEGRGEVVLSYLFGSYLQKPPERSHDLDIAVYAEPASLEALDRELPYGYGPILTAELTGLLGYPSVDLSLLNHASPTLAREVIRRGALIFCRSEEERIRFEVRSLKRFADTEHIRRIKRRYMRQRIQEGLGAYGTERDR